MLGTKPGKRAQVKPVVGSAGYRFTVELGDPSDAEEAQNGTKLARGANFRCLLSGSPIGGDYIKSEARAGRMGARMMALVAEGTRTRIYLAPTEAMEAVAAAARPTWKPSGQIVEDARAFTPYLYGLSSWSDLFTDRQVLGLTIFSDLISEARAAVRSACLASGYSDEGGGLDAGGSGATAYADALCIYLAFALSRSIDRGSTICTWDSSPKMEALRNTFGRQALPMTWDFAEGNLFSESSGNWMNNVEWVAKTVAALPAVGIGQANQADAGTQTRSAGKVISSDPPYYDNIPYADLSDFFYVWLRRALIGVFPGLFATLAAPKAEELVATAYRHGGKENAEAFFLSGMTAAMRQISEQAHPAAPTTIYYAFKQSETESDGTGSTGWETFLEAVITAGFCVVGTWPVRTELANRMRGSESNALASSIVLVCRARRVVGDISRKDFVRELERVLPVKIADMTADPIASIAPVDLAQACIGPGIGLFSRYSAVIEADGQPMTVHNALVHINKAIDDHFTQAEGDLDADTRFCIGWFEQFGFEAGDFGQADVLARAKGTSVDGVKDSGVVEAGRGKVRLYGLKELPKDWDPTKDTRVPVWEALHHLCRALGDSEGDAGALLAKMPEKQDAVRQLSYRLYTLCERKKWAAHAGAYNELITSWPAIVEASHGVGHVRTQMELV